MRAGGGDGVLYHADVRGSLPAPSRDIRQSMICPTAVARTLVLKVLAQKRGADPRARPAPHNTTQSVKRTGRRTNTVAHPTRNTTTERLLSRRTCLPRTNRNTPRTPTSNAHRQRSRNRRTRTRKPQPARRKNERRHEHHHNTPPKERNTDAHAPEQHKSTSRGPRKDTRRAVTKRRSAATAAGQGRESGEGSCSIRPQPTDRAFHEALVFLGWRV